MTTLISTVQPSIGWQWYPILCRTLNPVNRVSPPMKLALSLSYTCSSIPNFKSWTTSPIPTSTHRSYSPRLCLIGLEIEIHGTKVKKATKGSWTNSNHPTHSSTTALEVTNHFKDSWKPPTVCGSVTLGWESESRHLGLRPTGATSHDHNPNDEKQCWSRSRVMMACEINFLVFTGHPAKNESLSIWFLRWLSIGSFSPLSSNEVIKLCQLEKWWVGIVIRQDCKIDGVDDQLIK